MGKSLESMKAACSDSPISPERMSVRFEDDEETRKASGYDDATYKTIFDDIEQEDAKVR